MSEKKILKYRRRKFSKNLKNWNMGISKSLKRIFGRKKKEFVSSDIASDTSLKSPKNTRKGGTSQIIRKV